MAEHQKLSLSECSAFDHKNKLRDRLTGWGVVCKQRQNDNSRAGRIRRGVGKGGLK